MYLHMKNFTFGGALPTKKDDFVLLGAFDYPSAREDIRVFADNQTASGFLGLMNFSRQPWVVGRKRAIIYSDS